MNPADVRETIQTNFPSFTVESVDFLGQGMDSLAYEVNGEYVFRFPMFEGVSRQIGVESCLLPKLQPMLDLAIPQFEFFGQQPNGGSSFAGYRTIKGVEFAPELLFGFDKLSPNGLLGKIRSSLNVVWPMCKVEVRRSRKSPNRVMPLP